MKKNKNVLMLIVVFVAGVVAGLTGNNSASAEKEIQKEIQKEIEYIEIFIEVEKEVPVEVIKEVEVVEYVEVIKEIEVPVETIKEIEVPVEVESFKESGEVLTEEIVKELEDIEVEVEVKNEDTIYNMFDIGDEIYIMPLKATVFDLAGSEYTVLSDGYGSLYIVNYALKDGQNYVGKVDGRTDELIEYKESDFEFTYEEYFEMYKHEEIDWAISQLEKEI